MSAESALRTYNAAGQETVIPDSPSRLMGTVVGHDRLGRGAIVERHVSGFTFFDNDCFWATFMRDWSSDRSRRLKPATLHNTRFIRCRFTTVHFPRTIFDRVSFRDCVFDNCDFRECAFYKCDLRFARFTQTTFQDATMYLCDLFRAWFADANMFSGADTTLRLTSLGVELGGTDIPWPAIVPAARAKTQCRWTDRLAEDDEKNALDPRVPETVRQRFRQVVREAPDDWNSVTKCLDDGCGVLQEDPKAFERFVKDHSDQWRDEDPDYPFEDGDCHWERIKDDRPLSAASVFRALAGMYDARGRYAEAKDAYIRAKRLEEPTYGTWGKTTSRVARWTCSYGESAERVLACFGVLLLLGIPLFWFVASGSSLPRIGEAALLSFEDLIANLQVPLPHIFEQVAAGVLTALGLATLGLLGFVLGNVLRRR